MIEKNRSEIIHDALNQLDEDLIEEVNEVRENAVNTTDEQGSSLRDIGSSADKKSQKPFSWRKWTALAASICVLAVVGWVWSDVIIISDENAMEEGIVYEEQDRGNEEEVISSDDEKYKQEMVIDSITDDLESENIIEEQNLTQSAESPVGQQQPFQSATIESLKGTRGVIIPEADVSMEKQDGIESDMMAFFIYEGRCYVENGYYENVDFVGDYVGTAIGMIDEWTESDGYVDYAGSVSGKFYEVKGYSPAFMLCIKYENGRVQTFVHNNGIELEKGSDLIKTRLNLQGNYEEVGFCTYKEWNESLAEPHLLSDTHRDLFDAFLVSFCEADFMYLEDTTLELEGENRYARDEDNYYLCFYTKEGLKFCFWLLEDGYVIFQGLNGVCVQIDVGLYAQIIEVLK